MTDTTAKTLVISFTLCISCAQEPTSSPDQFDTWGPFAVGTTAVDVPAASELTLTTQVWFPVDLPYSEASSLPLYYYEGIASGEAIAEQTPACSQTHPVFLFSHGHNGVRYQSIYLMEFLASHGYIVLAPDHKYNTFYDADESHLTDIVTRRPKDLTDTFDWLLKQVNTPSSPFFGCANPQGGFAVGGHSFGGYTALASGGSKIDVQGLENYCQTEPGFLCNTNLTTLSQRALDGRVDLSDPRVWGTVALSPAGYTLFHKGIEDLSVPTIILTGDTDTSTPLEIVKPLFDGMLTTPRFFGVFKDTGHVSFSNACDFTPADFEECSDNFRPYQEIQTQSRSLVLAFLQSLKGNDRAEEFLFQSPPQVHWTIVQ